MRRLLLTVLFLAVLCGVRGMCPAIAAQEEPVLIYLTFSDGTRVQAQPVPGQTDWYAVNPGKIVSPDGVLLEISGGSAAAYAPKNGSRISVPFCGAELNGSGYLPVSLLDGSGQAVRTLRLYVSGSGDQKESAEEAVSLYATLTADAPLTDAQGNTHLLSGTLAKNTRVHLIAVRQTENGTLYRLDINGEVAYLPQEALSFAQEDQPLIASALSGGSAQDDGLSFAVTLYEAGLRSGKGNNDRNLIARIAKDTVVLVFSQLTDDDGKLLDLVYCPDAQLMGYVHDSQLRHLSHEESSALFSLPQDGDESMPEFVDGTVAADTYLYAYPDRNGKPAAELKKGQQVFLYTSIQDTGGSWYLVQAGEALGYLTADLVLPLDGTNDDVISSILSGAHEDEALMSKYALVDKAEILMYGSPSLSGECLGRLRAGELLVILEDATWAEGLEWLRVQCEKGTGYVLADQADRVMINSYLLGRPEMTKEGAR